MKISKEAISVLKNYAQISNNLRIYPGNELTVLSPQQSIFAKAMVPDTFPVDVCIYELNSFLDLLTYMEDQEVEFGEKSLKISNNGSTFEYRYADPSVIIAPPAGKTIELDSYYTFTLTNAEIIMLNKAIAISNAEIISLKADGVKAILEVSNKSRNVTWSKTLGETALTFDGILDVQNFRVVADTYLVTLSKKKFLHFKSENAQTPQYWLALDPKSTV